MQSPLNYLRNRTIPPIAAPRQRYSFNRGYARGEFTAGSLRTKQAERHYSPRQPLRLRNLREKVIERREVPPYGRV
jgi:hypothetical protein